MMKKITELGGYSVAPSFSADGKHLVFTSSRNKISAQSKVYLMDSDGNNLHRMPSFGRNDFTPVFDRTGCFIAYASDPIGDGLVSDCTISVTDISGELVKRLAHTGTDYVFSPDGRYLALSTGAEIYLEDIQALSSSRLTCTSDFEKGLNQPTSHNRRPAFHPTKDIIAFTSSRDRFRRNEVYTMMLDGTQQRRLTFMKDGATTPIFSRNGETLYFISDRLSERSIPHIFSCNLDGSNLNTFPNSQSVYGDISLSLDGRWLIYTSYSDEDQKISKLDISLMDVNTGNVYKLVCDGHYNRYPRLSPNLNSMIYCSRRDGVMEIYSLSIEMLTS